MPLFGSRGSQTKRYAFTPEARSEIRSIRSGAGLAGRATKGSLDRAEDAAAQLGGPLPQRMFKAARKGRLTKKIR